MSAIFTLLMFLRIISIFADGSKSKLLPSCFLLNANIGKGPRTIAPSTSTYSTYAKMAWKLHSLWGRKNLIWFDWRHILIFDVTKPIEVHHHEKRIMSLNRTMNTASSCESTDVYHLSLLETQQLQLSCYTVYWALLFELYRSRYLVSFSRAWRSSSVRWSSSWLFLQSLQKPSTRRSMFSPQRFILFRPIAVEWPCIWVVMEFTILKVITVFILFHSRYDEAGLDSVS